MERFRKMCLLWLVGNILWCYLVLSKSAEAMFCSILRVPPFPCVSLNSNDKIICKEKCLSVDSNPRKLHFSRLRVFSSFHFISKSRKGREIEKEKKCREPILNFKSEIQNWEFGIFFKRRHFHSESGILHRLSHLWKG